MTPRTYHGAALVAMWRSRGTVPVAPGHRAFSLPVGRHEPVEKAKEDKR